MKLPRITLRPAPVATATARAPLPEITFRAAAVVPPIVFELPKIAIPVVSLPCATVPLASVPMKHPSTVIESELMFKPNPFKSRFTVVPRSSFVKKLLIASPRITQSIA